MSVIPTHSAARGRPGGRGPVPGSCVLFGALLLLVASCAPPGEERAGGTAPDSAALAGADDVLAEVAGAQFADLSMKQRWRAVASLGTGLPPTDLSRSDLPEPRSTGAGLMEVYCVQCHWIPTPEMHSAREWEILLPRMLLRARLLKTRVDGDQIPDSFTGEAQFRVVPTPAHLDSLRAYLTRNALPVVDPDQLPETEAASLYVEKCSVCHETPTPEAHVASDWKAVVTRMQTTMRIMQVDTLSSRELSRIVGFLEQHAAAGD